MFHLRAPFSSKDRCVEKQDEQRPGSVVASRGAEPVRARSDQAALAANGLNGRSIPYNFRRPRRRPSHDQVLSLPDRRSHALYRRIGQHRARTVVELGASREAYDRLSVPLIAIGTPQADLDAMPDAGHVHLVLGQGRLGLEWLKAIEFVER